MGKQTTQITVGLVGPANWLADNLLQLAVVRLEEAGFGVKMAPNLGLHLHDMPGTPQQRAAGLMALVNDPEVDVLWSVGGGYGCTQIINLLDWDALQKAAKPLIGYSDVTYLLNAWAHHGIALGWHGPMPRDLAEQPERADLPVLLRTLGNAKMPAVDPQAFSAAKVLNSGQVQGVLWGGGLSVLASMAGTELCPHRNEPSILFIEEIGERIHKLDKWLYQLRHAGWLDTVRGVLVGRMTNIDDYAPKPFGLSVDEVVLGHFGSQGIPVVTGLDCGHAGLNFPLPFGAVMRLVASADHVTLQAI